MGAGFWQRKVDHGSLGPPSAPCTYLDHQGPILSDQQTKEEVEGMKSTGATKRCNRQGWITFERSFLCPEFKAIGNRSLYSNILHECPPGGTHLWFSVIYRRLGELRFPQSESSAFLLQQHQGGSLLNAQVDHFLSVDNKIWHQTSLV